MDIDMDGSVNDVDFEEVLDSLDGPEIEKIDVAIRLFSFEALKMLVTNARGKFPNAVILVTGYYSPFSKDSNHGRLEELAKYMSGKPGWQLAANDFLTSLWGKILTHGFFELIGATKDVDELVAEAIHRSEFAHSRGLYWMRRAVTELNESGQRGPGLYFVHPGFRPENSLFASTPFLHQGYKSPDEASDRHTVHDAALDERRRQIPRFELLSELKEARRTLAPINLVLSRPSGISLPVLPNKEDFVTLLSKLDGPISLRDQLSEIIEGPVTRKRVRGVMDALDSEIGRIKHAWIASFVHPNEAGARRYADAIVDRYKRHRQFSLRSDLTRLAATDQQASSNIVSVHRTLNRYGFDPRYGLRSCLEHMIVDSIAVEMTMKSLFPDIPVFDPQELTRMFLGIGNGKRWRLQNPFGKLNTIDTFGTLRLDDIEQLALEVDEGIAELRDFKLIINGKAVFHSSQNTPLESGDRLMFAYPA